MIRSMLALVIFASAALPTVAAEWGYVSPVIGKTPSGASIRGTMEIETNSVVQTGSLVKAWFRQTYKKDVVDPVNPARPIRRMKLLYGHHCDAHQRALLQILYEDAAGETVYSAAFPEETAKFEVVIPDTTGEAWLEAACRIAAMKRAAAAKP
jgi:hypothetical protein